MLFRNALREARDLRAADRRRAAQAPRRRSTAPPEDLPENPVSAAAARSARDDVLLTRFDAAALVPVLQGRQLLLVHVERASDILQVLALQAANSRPAARAGRRDRGLAGRRPDRRGAACR